MRSLRLSMILFFLLPLALAIASCTSRKPKSTKKKDKDPSVENDHERSEGDLGWEDGSSDRDYSRSNDFDPDPYYDEANDPSQGGNDNLFGGLNNGSTNNPGNTNNNNNRNNNNTNTTRNPGTRNPTTPTTPGGPTTPSNAPSAKFILAGENANDVKDRIRITWINTKDVEEVESYQVRWVQTGSIGKSGVKFTPEITLKVKQKNKTCTIKATVTNKISETKKANCS